MGDVSLTKPYRLEPVADNWWKLFRGDLLIGAFPTEKIAKLMLVYIDEVEEDSGPILWI